MMMSTSFNSMNEYFDNVSKDRPVICIPFCVPCMHTHTPTLVGRFSTFENWYTCNLSALVVWLGKVSHGFMSNVFNKYPRGIWRIVSFEDNFILFWGIIRIVTCHISIRNNNQERHNKIQNNYSEIHPEHFCAFGVDFRSFTTHIFIVSPGMYAILQIGICRTLYTVCPEIATWYCSDGSGWRALRSHTHTFIRHWAANLSSVVHVRGRQFLCWCAMLTLTHSLLSYTKLRGTSPCPHEPWVPAPEYICIVAVEFKTPCVKHANH